jgi:hypothetical protein
MFVSNFVSGLASLYLDRIKPNLHIGYIPRFFLLSLKTKIFHKEVILI